MRLINRAVCPLVWPVFAAAVGAQPRLVVDLNRAPGAAIASRPRDIVQIGNEIWFQATTLAAGAELFAINASGALRQVGDLAPGPASSNPTAFTLFTASVLLVATSPQHGTELWVVPSGGTPRVLADIVPGVGSSAPAELIAVGARVFFVAGSGAGGRELWVTDGNTGGTQQVADILPGVGSSSPSDLVAFGNGVAFIADDGMHGTELWMSDGTAAGTRLVRDVNPGISAGAYRGVRPALLGNRLLFRGTDPALGTEPWITDGTANGTVQLIDAVPGLAGGDPSDFTTLSTTRCIFAALVSNFGRELCVTDGTPGGTAVIDLVPGAGGSLPRGLRSDGTGRVFFGAQSPTTGLELSVSDGTPAGSAILDVLPGVQGLGSGSITAANGIAWLAATDGSVYRSDGTLAGTQSLGAVVFDTSSPPAQLRAVGANLYFAGSTDGDFELWSSNGTAVGTRRLFDIEPTRGTASADPQVVDAMAGRIVFGATVAGTAGLYASDGTPAGTHLLAAGLVQNPTQPTSTGDRLFLPLELPTGLRYAVTDGTAAGTRLLSAPVPRRGQAGGIALDATRALLAAEFNGWIEAWVSDGSDAGTQRLAPGSILLRGDRAFTRAGRAGYFLTANQDRLSLWRTDGTPAGTTALRLVRPIGTANTPILGAIGDRLVFASDSAAGIEPWITDGTVAGTRQLANLSIGSTSTGFPFNASIEFEGGVLFAAVVQTALRVFATDGVSVTEMPVPTLAVGAPPWLMARMGRRALTVTQPAQVNAPRELFVTDGTVAGTSPAPFLLPAGVTREIAPAGEDAVVVSVQSFSFATTEVFAIRDEVPPALVSLGTVSQATSIVRGPPRLAGGKLYFSGYDPRSGTELWATLFGPVAQAEGLGCGSRAVRLSATPPRLGSALTLAVDGNAPQTIIALAVPAPTPLRFAGAGGGCVWFLGSPLVAVALPQNATSLVVPVPNRLDLAGQMLEAQAAVGPSSVGVDLSNGLRLQIDV